MKIINQWIKIEKIPEILASAYEKATRMVIVEYYGQVAEEIVSAFKSGVILDLGTGPGYLPLEIVRRTPDINVVGVDLSRKLIQMAQTNTGMLHSLKNPVTVLNEIHRVLKNEADAWIYGPANIATCIDTRKWKASLNFRERIFLGLFKLIGLHKPIAAYTREQVMPMIEATDFEFFEIDERKNEIRIKLRKS